MSRKIFKKLYITGRLLNRIITFVIVVICSIFIYAFVNNIINFFFFFSSSSGCIIGTGKGSAFGLENKERNQLNIFIFIRTFICSININKKECILTNKNDIKLAPESIPTSNLNIKTYTKIVLNCFVDGQELSWRDVKKTLNNEKIDEIKIFGISNKLYKEIINYLKEEEIKHTIYGRSRITLN